MAGGLVDQVRPLLDDAISLYDSDPVGAHLTVARQRLDEPLRVAIAGKVKAGKSTLLNALVGEELAPTDAGECTKIVTWYHDGVTYRVTMYPTTGEPTQVTFSRDAGAIDVHLGGRSVSDVERLDVEWPSASLRDMTLIDTPGLGSMTTEASERSTKFLTPGEEQPGQADAVLYLMKHLHSDDIDFLESFHDDIGQANPVNAIAVLSRADEVAVGRLDAMESAARIAQRYSTEPKVRRVCQAVTPVAGLLAQAGETLTEDEFHALQKLAAAPPADADRLMLTADRFLNAETAVELTPLERQHLAGRFGLFGVRLAVDLLRRGTVKDSPGLARALVERSGIAELRNILRDHFGARRDLLKARSALLAVESTARAHPRPGSEKLDAEVERILSGAHELAELHLLQAMRSGAVQFRDDDETSAAERLLTGATPAERAGLPADARPDAVRAGLAEAVTRWQRRAESPMTSREVADAARILVRTGEGLLMTLAQQPSAS
jgi:predicted GTPase